MRLIVPAVCLPLVLAASQVTAQQVPLVQLTKPEVEFSEPFDQVTAVRELSDGRVIVADLFGRTVSVVDFKAGTAKAIGREGQGPNEFAFPSALIPLPGDTTWLVDPAQGRFLVIHPDGTPAGTVAFPDKLAGTARFKGADAMGRIYAQASPFGSLGGVPDPKAFPDSAPVMRWDRGSKAMTEVGKVKIPAVAISTAGSAGSRSVMMAQQPFPAADDWAVTRAGRVGFARSSKYHLEWAAPAPVVGPPVSFATVPVTDADKKELKARQEDRRGALRITDGGPARASSGTPPPEPKAPALNWPESKPPFVQGSAMASPFGELWVERSQPAKAPELVDVFDPAGRLARQVRLPAGSRLVAVGINGLYVARPDEDGLWYLQRFKNP
jgi:hypothetical protein